MNENKSYCRETEREINLVDLFFHLLEHWRSLIAAILIGAVLGGGICLLKVELVEMTPEQAVLAGTYIAPPEIQKRMEQALLYRKLYEKQAEYLRESFVMQMDPNRVCTGTVEYYLAAGDDTRLLGEKLKSILNDDAFLLELRDMVGSDKEPQYIRELLGCQVSVNNSMAAVGTDQEAYTDAVITYTVSFGERSICNEILQAIESKAESVADEWQGDYAVSRFAKVNDGIEIVANRDFMSQQKTSTDNANTYVSNYLKVESEFNANPWDAAYYNIFYLGMDTSGIEAYNMGVKMPVSAKMAVKWLIVGLILAVGIWGAWHVVRYLLDKSVKTAEEVKNNYGLALLGYMAENSEKKNIIDRWIQKWSERYSMPVDSSEYVESMVNALGREHVVLCGRIEDKPAQLLKSIMADGSRMHRSEFVHQNQDALQKAKKADGEILVIQKDKTCYQEIVRELEVCRMQGIDVLGAIVIK